MPSKARVSFDRNRQDVDRLWTIHGEVAGAGVGRKHDVEVLNRAAIVFVTASWEAYVEDVATEAFDLLLANAPSADKIPAKVRTLASKELVDAPDKRRVWELADGGWRTVLQKHPDAAIAQWVQSLNTPRAEQVDQLFESLIGLTALHTRWSWQGMNANDAKGKLDRYITIRGQIAHRVSHDESVYKNWGTDYLAHVERLVEKTDEAVASFVLDTVGKAPW
jgi:hypothetical protein